jgi:hypothetical protein
VLNNSHADTTLALLIVAGSVVAAEHLDRLRAGHERKGRRRRAPRARKMGSVGAFTTELPSILVIDISSIVVFCVWRRSRPTLHSTSALPRSVYGLRSAGTGSSDADFNGGVHGREVRDVLRADLVISGAPVAASSPFADQAVLPGRR